MRCVAELGYARATIREIASAAGVTSASLYHYYPTKDALVRATFLQMAEVSVPRLRAAADARAGVLDKLEAVLDEADHLVRDFPHAVAFDRALHAAGAAARELASTSDRVRDSVEGVVAEIVQQAAERGVLADGVDAASATRALLVLRQGLYHLAATATPEEYTATAEVLRKLLRGTLFDHARDT